MKLTAKINPKNLFRSKKRNTLSRSKTSSFDSSVTTSSDSPESSHRSKSKSNGVVTPPVHSHSQHSFPCFRVNAAFSLLIHHSFPLHLVHYLSPQTLKRTPKALKRTPKAYSDQYPPPHYSQISSPVYTLTPPVHSHSQHSIAHSLDPAQPKPTDTNLLYSLSSSAAPSTPSAPRPDV
ncbi:hypothetical protein HanIR_Chr01g0041841 [Helianthus annuus]|nr:hypothetical protein HanIR_Chr01g0041841 [Helianthus annuus]